MGKQIGFLRMSFVRKRDAILDEFYDYLMDEKILLVFERKESIVKKVLGM